MYVYGTKPDGTTYASEFQINPWATPTSTNTAGSLSEFMTQLNNAFVQGSERFATARLENGNLIVSSVGNGEAFSVFFGEDGAVPSTASPGTPPFFSTTAAAGTHVNTGALDTTTLDSGTPSASDTVLSGGVGLLNPTFTLGGGVPGVPFSISVQVNNQEVGSIVIPSGTAIGDSFSLGSYPHVEDGDTITYAVSNIPAGVTIDAATSLVLDNNVANLTQDLDGDGRADLFVEDSSVDANAWTYSNNTNDTFNWYRVRTVPEVVGTSIEVYDAQGGRHNLEARFFRIGTRTPTGSSERINSWDMIVDIPFGEGTLVDDLVTGIEFDQDGRYTGAIGTTIHGTSLNATSFVGNPSSGTIQVNWAATGPTDPATIITDFGANNSVDGLTGFGSTSTAAMVNQDGFTDGKLDAISVSAEGDIVALYTNGISRRLAQIPLVTFRNAAGLQSTEGSLWQLSTNSGSPTRRTAGQNSGLITSGALESANVDIATEFTRLITSQRGFQVSARVVQTTDEVLEELANLVR
jgi:flagellar hook-basal body protein